MEIHPIIEINLSAMAGIHLMAFPDSALTQLGIEAIRRYYSWQLNGPHDSMCIGAFVDTKLVGFCLAGVFRGGDDGFLRKNIIFLICRLISHPWLLFQKIVRNRIDYIITSIKRYIRREKKRIQSPKPVIEKFGILAIAVHPQYQYLGIGKLLMQEIEISARQKGFASIRLTVHPDNYKAVSFYERLGWMRVPASDGVWSGFMVKKLGDSNE